MGLGNRLRMCNSRKRTRTCADATVQALRLRPRSQKGSHRDVIEGGVEVPVLPEVQGEGVQAEDDNVIKYMPLRAIYPPYTPYFDLPDHGLVSAQFLNKALTPGGRRDGPILGRRREGNIDNRVIPTDSPAPSESFAGWPRLLNRASTFKQRNLLGARVQFGQAARKSHFFGVLCEDVTNPPSARPETATGGIISTCTAPAPLTSCIPTRSACAYPRM
ncbi:hypothetical protein BJY52DRAFT_1226239 [Lactarius psammicola]|nr:hypothetical protein BJY52DRAFT_1226239 [Lactarius psammicola]